MPSLYNYSNKLIINGDSVVHVYATVQAPDFIGTSTYHIGLDLNSSKVVDVKGSHPYETDMTKLNDLQLVNLATSIRKKLKLKNIFTISGKARTGKDTVALILKSLLSKTKFDTRIKSLGEPIKEINQIINGTSPHKNRKSLVSIGQGFRERDPNIWIKVWLRRALEEIVYLTQDYLFIVPDVRQPNEFEFFKSLGATTFKVQSPEEDRLKKITELDGQQDAEDESLLNDETESYVEGFITDYILFNNYDDQLRKDVEYIFNKIIGEEFSHK